MNYKLNKLAKLLTSVAMFVLFLAFTFAPSKTFAQFSNPTWEQIYDYLYVQNNSTVSISGVWNINPVNPAKASNTPNGQPRTIVMESGASIVVAEQVRLNWRNLTIKGNANMWVGIEVPAKSPWFIFEHCTISDAHRAISFPNSRDGSGQFGINNNTFSKNNVGVYWKGVDNSVQHVFNANTFIGGTFLPAYPGQPQRTSPGIGVRLEDYKYPPNNLFVMGAEPSAVTSFTGLAEGVSISNGIGNLRFKDLVFNNNGIGIRVADAGRGMYHVISNDFNNSRVGILMNGIFSTQASKGGTANIIDNTLNGSINTGIAVSDFSATKIQYNTLNNVASTYDGISVLRSSNLITNNTVNKGFLGIVIYNCNLHSTDVNTNTITEATNGIYGTENAPAIKFRLSGNTITTIGGTLASTAVPGGIFMAEHGIPFSMDNAIEGNTITSSQVEKDGILLYSCANLNVVGNSITFNNSPLLSQNYKGHGIYLAGGEKNYLNSNYVYNTLYNIQGDNFTSNDVGIRIEFSPNNSLCCNSVNKTTDGLMFNYDCSNMRLTSNTMLRNALGLRISEAGIIGKQEQQGNRFVQYTSPIGALHEDPDQFIVRFSKFLVHTGQPSFYFPFTSSAAPDWFETIQGSPATCGLTPCVVAPQVIGDGDEWTSLDDVIAADAWVLPANRQSVKWSAQRNLYRKLSRNPSWLNTPSRQSFANAMSLTSVGAFNNVDMHWKNAYSNLPVPLANLSTLYGQLNAELTTVEGYFAQLDNNSGDPVVLAANIEASAQIMEALQLQLGAAQQQNIDHLASIADQVSVENASIQTSTNYEEYQKTANGIYFATVAKGQISFSTNQANQLYNIASTCISEGGPGVVLARSLFSLYDPTANFIGVQSCTGNNPGNGAKIKGLVAEYSITPNPADETIWITYKVATSESTITLFDLSGKAVLSARLPSNQSRLPLEVATLPNGMYFAAFYNNGIQEKTQKIVINRAN